MTPGVRLRPHRPGDLGWIVFRHGVLYAQEWDWDRSHETLVAEIAAGFLRTFDPAHERCWIAARGLCVQAGFRLVRSEPHRSFGHDLVGEEWELAL